MRNVGIVSRASWLLWYAVTLHTIWALVFLFQTSPLLTTSTAAFYDIIPLTSQQVAVVLLCSCGLAVWSITRKVRNKRTFVALMLPVGIMALSATGAMRAVFEGHYADGVAQPPAFIFVDQLPTMLIVVFGVIAVLDTHFARLAGK